MTRIFLDASVIIASILSATGGSAKVIRLGRLGKWAQITSQTVIDEVKDHAEKIGKSAEEIDQFIKEHSLVVRQRITKSEIRPFIELVDESDAHLIAGSKLTGADFLVTLDKKHLLKLHKKDFPFKIITPGELLACLA